MKMTVKEIHPKIFLVTFDKRYDLCMTFVRFQEFYESPKFRNKYFELEEFMDWWADKYGIAGSFDYVAKWDGFNIPGYIVCRWIEQMTIHNGSFREKEKTLLNEIRKKLNGSLDSVKSIYIIGVNKETGESNIEVCKDHEVAHAFYQLYPQYREECKELLKKTPLKIKDKAIAALTELGYNKKVFDDEMQAYFSTLGARDSAFGARDSFVRHFKKFQRSCQSESQKRSLCKWV